MEVFNTSLLEHTVGLRSPEQVHTSLIEGIINLGNDIRELEIVCVKIPERSGTEHVAQEARCREKIHIRACIRIQVL